MLNREFIFSNPEVIKWLSKEFIFVAGDDWYRRRAQDDASVWFRNVAKQAGRGKNGTTMQGCYAVTPKGELLRFINTSDPVKFATNMLEAKKIWNGLITEKKVEIPDVKNHDFKVNVPPIDPAKDIVIKVQSRALTEINDNLERWHSKGKVGSRATQGHLWIKHNEWVEFTKHLNQLKVGNKILLPKRIANRITRYHLTDNTRGEGPAWKNDEVSQTQIDVTRTATGFEFNGKIHLETADMKRRYTGSLKGKLTLEKGTVIRPNTWTMTVYGKHIGEGPHTRNARPGAQPLAFTFEYLAKPTPLDLVPPQHMRWQKGYWEAEKH